MNDKFSDSDPRSSTHEKPKDGFNSISKEIGTWSLTTLRTVAVQNLKS